MTGDYLASIATLWFAYCVTLKDLALVDSSVPRHSLSPRTQIRLKTFIFIIGLIVFRLEFLAVRTPRSEIQ